MIKIEKHYYQFCNPNIYDKINEIIYEVNKLIADQDNGKTELPPNKLFDSDSTSESNKLEIKINDAIAYNSSVNLSIKLAKEILAALKK
jgi:hypothetical protein